MSVKILLLEDNDTIAQTFINNYGNALVKVTVVKTVTELFYELSQHEFDTVIIDPVMSATMDFPRLLEELSRRNIEIKIAYPNQIIPQFRDLAASKNIDNVSLKDKDQLLEIIQELIKKRSSGSTIELQKNDQKLEIKIIKIEVKLENLHQEVSKQQAKIEGIETNIKEQLIVLIELKNNQAVILDKLKTVEDDLDSVEKEDPETQLLLKDKEESTKRFIAIVSIITVLLTTIGVVATPFSNVITEWLKSPTTLKKVVDK